MMKHTKHLLVLWAALLLGAGNAWGAELGTGYTKITDITTLAIGDKVVVYCDDQSVGVTGWNGSKDATVAATGWVEYVVEAATNGVYLYDPTAKSYIASPGTSNQFKYGTKAVCTVNANGVLMCNSRYLVNNGTYYRMYSSISSYKPFYVYKLAGTPPTTVYLGLFLAAFVAVRACVRRVECRYATFHHIIMSKIDFRSVHFAKECFVFLSWFFSFCFLFISFA